METANTYTQDMLVRICKRENNTKRTYLVMNTMQGKHIAVSPTNALELFKALENVVEEFYDDLTNTLFIGFAETATAIGAQVALSANAKYIQTTREIIPDVQYLFFSEEHSHATEQKLVKEDIDSVIKKIDRIIFVEDEVTTGNTILNIINVIRKTYPDTNVKFGIIYSYTVRSVNGDVRSSYEAAKGVRFNVTPTVKIANVSNGVKVTWSKVENATGYTIYSATYNAKTKKWSGWTNRGTVKSGTTSWTDKKAKSGTYYKYTVRACYGSFRSSYKASDKIWFLAQPTVTVKKASNGINVSWTQCTGEKGYTVYRAEYNPTTKKWSGWKNMVTVGKDKKTWTDTSAKKGVYYKYTVRAVNGNYKSSYVASGSVKR